MVIGGCSGSTAGGVKLFRFLALLAVVRWLVARARLPREAEVPLRILGEHYHQEEAQGTVGLSVGIAGPGAPAGAKLLLIALMWMGRLEILPVLLLVRKAVVPEPGTGLAAEDVLVVVAQDERALEAARRLFKPESAG